jgi:translation initiation factor 2 alpha subunit (eIF-2alpha)
MEYKEGDLILGTVEDVNNTITSVNLDDGTKGIIISSEIASGRIKYMRMYVVPNKKIVCKVLSVNNVGTLNLSLRRVTTKEKQEVMTEYKQKLAIDSAFKQILGDSAITVEEKIVKDFGNLMNFVDKMENDENILNKYIPKEYISHIKKINDKRKKNVEIKYNVSIKCLESDGICRIKDVLDDSQPNLKITYISAGNFTLKYIADNFKKAKQDISFILDSILKKAKENHCEMDIKEDKK